MPRNLSSTMKHNQKPEFCGFIIAYCNAAPALAGTKLGFCYGTIFAKRKVFVDPQCIECSKSPDCIPDWGSERNLNIT